MTESAANQPSSPVDAFTGRTDYPLVVATVGDGLRSTGGCLVGFFTQCSIDPPRFLVCLSVLNHTFQLAQQCDGVVVHLLGEDQQATARLFAEETGDDTDKLARCHWRAGITGAPILTSCAAWLEGTIIGRHDLGDHQGLVLAPVDGGAGDRSGLLTFRDIGDQLRPGHPAD